MSRQKREWDSQVPYKPGVEVEVVPEDGISPPAELSSPSVSQHKGWLKCPECGREIWREFTGEYYHKLKCSKSNGIPYGDEKDIEDVNHKPGCTCSICSLKKARKK